MSEHVILLVSVFFLLFQSPAAFPDVVCNPQEKAINLAESSKVVLECKVVVAVGEMPEFEWSTSDSQAIKKIKTTEHTAQQGAWKNVTSIFTIYSKDKSPTFITEVDVQVVVNFKAEKSTKQTFKLMLGYSNTLILIIVGCVLGSLIVFTTVVGSVFVGFRRKKQLAGEGIDGNHPAQNSKEDDWQDVDLRANDLQPQQGIQGNSDGFSEVDAVFDNFTSLANENFTNKPIISQIPEFVEADCLPSMGKATVAVGGMADLGAGQVHVRDHEELEVIQRDLGSGYTAIRKISNGEYGFLPTSSLVFSD